MPTTILHTIFLSASILFSWTWTSLPSLNIYNLQLTGLLVLAYFGSKFFLRPSNQKTFNFTSTLILNTVCLLLVFSTGGVSSPLFFLLDLLLISLALLFEPLQAIIATIILISIFLFQNFNSLETQKIINLITLILMTPIAVVFSRNYLDDLQAKGRIKILEKIIAETETDSLLWISKTKPSLASILNSTTDLVMYFNSRGRDLLTPPAILEKLRSIQKDLITLYTSTGTLEKTIEEEADKIKL